MVKMVMKIIMSQISVALLLLSMRNMIMINNMSLRIDWIWTELNELCYWAYQAKFCLPSNMPKGVQYCLVFIDAFFVPKFSKLIIGDISVLQAVQSVIVALFFLSTGFLKSTEICFSIVLLKMHKCLKDKDKTINCILRSGRTLW